MIELAKVSKRFGARAVLDEVSLAVERGEVVGYVGPNGAGKTTTFRLLTGYLSPDAGSVRVGGDEPAQAHQHVGYQAEEVPLYPTMRVDEFLRFRGRLRGFSRAELGDRVAAALDAVDLADRKRSMISRLSRGMRQRVGLADALLAEPAALLLDEPTTGLDPVQRNRFRRLLERHRKDRAVLLSSHELSEVEAVADRVVVLIEGRIAATGTPAEIGREVGEGGDLRAAFLSLAGADGGGEEE